MAARREDDLVLVAFQMALTQREPQARLLHHSDTAGESTSREYQALLSAWGIEVSMSRKGDCYDNALIERFFATVKGECTDRQHWTSHSQARQAIFEYLEVFYNRKLRHSSLAYLSPPATQSPAPHEHLLFRSIPDRSTANRQCRFGATSHYLC